jgi:sugar lactone lactonase YvrE
MLNRRLLRLDSDGLTVVADLSKMIYYPCNDMVVDSQGRAYAYSGENGPLVRVK